MSHNLFSVKYFAVLLFLMCSVDLRTQNDSSINGNLASEVNSTEDSLLNFAEFFKPQNSFSFSGFKKENKSKLSNKLFHDHLIKLSDTNFTVVINPVVNFQYYNVAKGGADTTTYYVNTRGISVKGELGKKIFFSSIFVENQAVFPNYISNYIDTFGVVPGAGRVKPFKEEGVDYAFAESYISFSPVKTWNLQFGNNKRFFGNGYRSLVLSDNAFNYPHIYSENTFLKNRFKYVYLYGWMSTLNRLPNVTTVEAPFVRKNMSVHALEYSYKSIFKIQIFDASIWSRFDSAQTSVTPLSYQPIVGLSLVNTSSSVSHLAGVGVSVFPFKTLKMYSQVMSNLQNSSTTSFQLGLSGYRSFKNFGANLLAEFNKVSLNFYNGSGDFTNYAHYNQPIAHPLGSGFSELVTKLNIIYKRLGIKIQYNVSQLETDSLSTRKGFIFSKEVNPIQEISENNKGLLNYINIETYFVVNPSYNLNIYVGFTNRNLTLNANTTTDSFVYFGLKTSLFNNYFDF